MHIYLHLSIYSYDGKIKFVSKINAHIGVTKLEDNTYYTYMHSYKGYTQTDMCEQKHRLKIILHTIKQPTLQPQFNLSNCHPLISGLAHSSASSSPSSTLSSTSGWMLVDSSVE
jgi:hypothetical protein